MFRVWIAEPIPMKRELKHVPEATYTATTIIAEPIPMKRELKRVDVGSGYNGEQDGLQSLSR